MGFLNAATVASDTRYSFRNIEIGLVVGVAGGAVQTTNGIDIHLGDLIMSTAVIEDDFGRRRRDRCLPEAATRHRERSLKIALPVGEYESWAIC